MQKQQAASPIKLIPANLINLTTSLNQEESKNKLLVMSIIAVILLAAIYFLFRIIFTLYS